MKKSFLVLLLLSGLIFSGCAKQKSDNLTLSETQDNSPTTLQETTGDNAASDASTDDDKASDASTETTTDYSKYTGIWTTDGISKDSLLETGGTELTITVTNDNQISGSIFSQQGTSDRTANVDFSGEIKDNQLVYSFTDDGWDGKGTLHFDFKDNEIDINVTDYILADDNSTGWGINGSYVLLPVAVDDTKSYRDQCSFYPEITQYLESHGRTDTSNITDPLFDTDTQYYTAEDFSDAPESVLRVAKNEIYARHGYIFNDSDMNNYFRGMKWYTPSVKPADFSDSIFNEYEKANLELLKSLQ